MDGCLVPAEQHDFGCRDAWIGGEPALPRVSSTPLESLSFFASRAGYRPVSWLNGPGAPTLQPADERFCTSTVAETLDHHELLAPEALQI
jgi:hypothetical protein